MEVTSEEFFLAEFEGNGTSTPLPPHHVISLTSRLLLTVHLFNLWYTPLLALVGAVGNSLSLFVFCTAPSHRHLSSSFYLSALAISDTGFLATLLAVWLDDLQIGVKVMTPLGCPLIMYLGQVTCFLSVWLTVAFTVERFCAVVYPLTRPTVCTVSRARKVIFCLTVVALLGFCYVLVIAQVMEYPGHFEHANGNVTEPLSSSGSDVTAEEDIYLSQDDTKYNSSVPPLLEAPHESIWICSVSSEHVYISSIASYIDSVVTLILPFFIITFLNVRISLCVWRLRESRESIVALAKLPRRAEPHSATSNGGGCHRSKSTRFGNNNAHSGPSSNAAEVRVTKTLLLVSTVFLFLNLPSHAVRAIIFIQSLWGTEEVTEEFQAAMQISNILFNTNFSVNFLLYCLSGRNFRKSLKGLLLRSGRGRHRRAETVTNARRGQSEVNRSRWQPSVVTEMETYA